MTHAATSDPARDRTLARDVNRGSYCAPTDTNTDPMIPVGPTPLLVEIPYWQQNESQGPRPYFMYANIAKAPEWGWPNGYLLGRHGAQLVFEEPQG